MRPGHPRAQSQHRAGIEQHLIVEARAQLSPGVGGGAPGKAQPEAAAVDIGFVVVGGSRKLCAWVPRFVARWHRSRGPFTQGQNITGAPTLEAAKAAFERHAKQRTDIP